ncbi:hypothetical protein CISG_01503 [Coccidioides immitis RMSCC 3703]|uniref:Uncharacterized protein n=1 Tax=Coccidioides immitis RMSCC 3703 TaxID=454286 RepID=A0A0J8QZ39_COCIT|nr:hypothetical protein CISG_01503 [Coccidioides immitis RMSCC 3703]
MPEASRRKRRASFRQRDTSGYPNWAPLNSKPSERNGKKSHRWLQPVRRHPCCASLELEYEPGCRSTSHFVVTCRVFNGHPRSGPWAEARRLKHDWRFRSKPRASGAKRLGILAPRL